MANSERNMYYKHNMSMYGNNASIVEELKYLWDNYPDYDFYRFNPGYYKEKYLKYDKAYYVTSTYTPAVGAQPEPAINAYLLLERDNSSSATGNTTNIDLNVKCPSIYKKEVK